MEGSSTNKRETFCSCEADTRSQCQQRPGAVTSHGKPEGRGAQLATQRCCHYAVPGLLDPSPRCSRQPGDSHGHQQPAWRTPRSHLDPGTLRLRALSRSRLPEARHRLQAGRELCVRSVRSEGLCSRISALLRGCHLVCFPCIGISLMYD